VVVSTFRHAFLLQLQIQDGECERPYQSPIYVLTAKHLKRKVQRDTRVGKTPANHSFLTLSLLCYMLRLKYKVIIRQTLLKTRLLSKIPDLFYNVYA